MYLDQPELSVTDHPPQVRWSKKSDQIRAARQECRIDNHITAISVLSDRTQRTLAIHSSSCSAATADRCAIRGTR